MELTKKSIRSKFEDLGCDFFALWEFCYNQSIPLAPVFKVSRLFPEYGNQHTPDRDKKIAELKKELGI